MRCSLGVAVGRPFSAGSATTASAGFALAQGLLGDRSKAAGACSRSEAGHRQAPVTGPEPRPLVVAAPRIGMGVGGLLLRGFHARAAAVAASTSLSAPAGFALCNRPVVPLGTGYPSTGHTEATGGRSAVLMPLEGRSVQGRLSAYEPQASTVRVTPSYGPSVDVRDSLGLEALIAPVRATNGT